MEVNMKERPILFSGEMVRAILDGRKTQTRMVVKPQPSDCIKVEWVEISPKKSRNSYAIATDHSTGYWMPTLDGISQSPLPILCPYGVPGDRLWVRETLSKGMEVCTRPKILYEATRTAMAYSNDKGIPEGWLGFVPWRWKKDKLPSIHMPRWASRITLEIVNVRVERVQEITAKDEEAEGAPTILDNYPHQAFKHLWDSINAKRGHGWDANPWVWVIEFKKL